MSDSPVLSVRHVCSRRKIQENSIESNNLPTIQNLMENFTPTVRLTMVDLKKKYCLFHPPLSSWVCRLFFTEVSSPCSHPALVLLRRTCAGAYPGWAPKGFQGGCALVCILETLEEVAQQDEHGLKKQLACCELQSGLLRLSSGMQTQEEIH